MKPLWRRLSVWMLWASLLLLPALASTAPAETGNKLTGFLTVHDPNPQLLTLEGTISPHEYPKAPTVSGLAADGVTELLLVLDSATAASYDLSLRDENGLMEQVGGLRSLAGGEWAADLTGIAARSVNGASVAFALLRAPDEFVRPGQGDESRESRSLRLRALARDGSGNILAEDLQTLRLRRPPVVLIHGLWSAPTTWRWDWVLQNDPRFLVHPADYADTHDRSLDENAQVVRTAVRRALLQSRFAGVAATRVDVVGHSMGGLLARRHASGLPGVSYRRPNNYGAGDFYRLITLNTPHFGSPLADLVVDEDNNPTPIGMLTESMRCVSCGAVRDLRTDSPVLRDLPAAPVPSYALAGTGGDDLIDSGSLDQVPPEISAIVYLLDSLNLLGLVYTDGIEHDLVVERPSQEGGLAPEYTTSFGYVDSATNGTHNSVTGEERVGAAVLDLLHAPAETFAPGFPAAGPFFPAEKAAPSPPSLKLIPSGLTLTAPTPGLILPAGTTVRVVAEPTGGLMPVGVILYATFGSLIREEAPYEGELVLPPAFHGELEINAAAVDAFGTVTFADPVVVKVEADAPIRSLSARPRAVFLWEDAPAEKLRVSALYGDGVTRDLSWSGFGTVYSSTDTGVATVSTEGVVSRVAPGSAAVLIEKGTHQQRIDVVVLPPCSGDINGDFVVDSLDLFALCAEMEKPSPSTKADLNRDGTIDAADLFVLSEAYGRVCGN